MITPIHRLPFETLVAIFSFYGSCYKDLPLELLWVCRLWRAVALDVPPIWSKVRLCTWTNVEKVAFILARTVNSPLHVAINTNADSFLSGPHKSPQYAALWHVATQGQRWRSLTITSFPPEEFIDSHEFLKALPIAFSKPLEGLQSLKIEYPGGISLLPIIPFHQNTIINMELSLCSALHHFMQPQFVTTFHALIRFKVQFNSISPMVDILAQFYQLETLEASGLDLPPYPVEMDLRLVHTLKYMKINRVSVQWMAGRTFPNLKECEIIEPLNPEMISLGFNVKLPICTVFTYDAQSINTLTNFYMPILDILTIRSNVLLEGMWSGQLTAVWSAATGEAALLKPRILYLDTRCNEQHLIEALSMLPELEELHLGALVYDRLGKMFFTSLQAEETKEGDTQEVTQKCRLCPSLKTLSIHSSFWADDTPDKITPLLDQLVKSRQQTDTALSARVQDSSARAWASWPSPLWVPDPAWGSPLHGSP